MTHQLMNPLTDPRLIAAYAAHAGDTRCLEEAGTLLEVQARLQTPFSSQMSSHGPAFPDWLGPLKSVANLAAAWGALSLAFAAREEAGKRSEHLESVSRQIDFLSNWSSDDKLAKHRSAGMGHLLAGRLATLCTMLPETHPDTRSHELKARRSYRNAAYEAVRAQDPVLILGVAADAARHEAAGGDRVSNRLRAGFWVGVATVAMLFVERDPVAAGTAAGILYERGGSLRDSGAARDSILLAP